MNKKLKKKLNKILNIYFTKKLTGSCTRDFHKVAWITFFCTYKNCFLEIGLLEVSDQDGGDENISRSPSPMEPMQSNAKKRPLEDSTNLKPIDDFTIKKLKIHETPPPGILRKWK